MKKKKNWDALGAVNGEAGRGKICWCSKKVLRKVRSTQKKIPQTINPSTLISWIPDLKARASTRRRLIGSSKACGRLTGLQAGKLAGTRVRE